jgi:hypothetical protein
MQEQLTRFFATNFRATTNEIEQLVSAFSARKVKKNEILISKGDICRFSYFVCKGAIRAYFVSDDGEEATRYIAIENQFITTIHSFISQTATNEFIQASLAAHNLVLKFRLHGIPLLICSVIGSRFT